MIPKLHPNLLPKLPGKWFPNCHTNWLGLLWCASCLLAGSLAVGLPVLFIFHVIFVKLCWIRIGFWYFSCDIYDILTKNNGFYLFFLWYLWYWRVFPNYWKMCANNQVANECTNKFYLFFLWYLWNSVESELVFSIFPVIFMIF